MKKKIISALSAILVVCMLAGIGVLAAPAVLGPNASGNTNSLVTIKNPASLSASTYDRTYTVTTAGRPGVDVTIYRRSNYDGNFYKVFQGGYTLSGTIGYGGVYVVSVELIEGGNKFLVYAENANERQIIKIDITRLTQSQIDRITGLSVGDLFTY